MKKPTKNPDKSNIINQEKILIHLKFGFHLWLAWLLWIKEEVAMPTSRRKGVPGRSTLPPDFVHNPLNAAAAAASPLLNLLGLCQQPLSLGNLQAPAPLALTYPHSRGPASSKAAESVKSASAWDC